MIILKLTAHFAITAAALVLLAGVIKFNFFDVPYVGEPRVYKSAGGESVEVRDKADGSLAISFPDSADAYLRAFSAQPTPETAEPKYTSDNGRYVLLSTTYSLSIDQKSGEHVFRGKNEQHDSDAPPYSGRLVFGHESQTFQPCGQFTVYWVSDPGNVLLDRYEALIQGKKPYTAVYAQLIGALSPIDSSHDGFAEGFNTELIVAELVVMTAIEQQPQCTVIQTGETLYFSQSTGVWQDHIGVCKTCSPENGFGADGTVDDIIWRELRVSLKNDLGESPGIDEVQAFFQSQYAEESGYYPVHLTKNGDVFLIQIPVPVELRNIDFLDRQGALRATYDVDEQHK